MSLYDALKFVQGSISKKGLVEGLTNFRISDGKVKGYNGVIALCSPIDTPLDCTPEAEPLLKAIQRCEDTVQMTLLANGKLNIKSGGFRVSVSCLEGETPHVDPEGEIYPINGETLIKGLTAVKPFISSDASRPWSIGVLLENGSVFATNNVTIAQYTVGDPFPVRCAIPRMAVHELLRIKEVPNAVQVCKNNLTFHYESGRWMRTQLLSLEWPNLENILDKFCDPQDSHTVDETLFDALENIKPFVDGVGKVYIDACKVRTHWEESDGASHHIKDNAIHGVYNIDLLLLMKDAAETYNFSGYNIDPKLAIPGRFYGDRLRGVISGFLLGANE